MYIFEGRNVQNAIKQYKTELKSTKCSIDMKYKSFFLTVTAFPLYHLNR